MGWGPLTFLTNMRAAGKKSVIGKEVAAMNFASPVSDMLQLADCIQDDVIGMNGSTLPRRCSAKFLLEQGK
ncbi:hypothetical protein JAU75_13370 [Ochrobactrum sp. Q0168]|uniref:hypothetical protein n=1 Tax=Ochrobactrum sp. Q0168 TaxID=2793241 RepID=UPI0018ED1630|nr:hypothetical protein [Ochrobactrum sp. Q0168]